MKEQILAAIRSKFPNAKLSAKRMDAIAASIEAKAGTDETLIDSSLDALNELYPLTEIAKDDHIRSTLEGKLKATQTSKKETPGTPEKVELPDDTPQYVKDLLSKLDSVTTDLAAIKGEKVATTIRGKAAEKLKEVPETFWSKRAIPQTEEEIEAFVTEVTTDYKAFTQDLTNKGLTILSTPKAAGGGAADKGEVAPEVKAFIAKNTPAAAPATA